MDTISQVLVVVMLVVGGIATLQLGTVRSLRSDREDYKERDARRVQEMAAMSAEITTLKNDRDAFQRAMRGDDHFDALGVQVDQMTSLLNVLGIAVQDHNEAAKTHWQQEIPLLTSANEILAAVRDRLPEGDS